MFKLSSAMVALVGMVLGASTTLAADKVMVNGVAVYQKPPSAYELAKTLFPPKRRSVVLNNEGKAPQQEVGSVAFMIKFKYDSTQVLPDSLEYLDALGDMLNFKQLKDKPLMIEGHADASGDSQYNMSLSEARAQAIKQYLTSVHRIKPDRLYTQGFGETKLLDSQHPGAQVNRRAEFRTMEDG